jgi:hypothetical protein
MKQSLVLLLLPLMIGCTIDKKESSSPTSDSTNVSLEKEDDINDTSHQKLLGAWAAIGSENATMLISKDSIYYIDSDKSFRYTLQGDTISIAYDDWTYSGVISKLKNDSLIIADESSESIFIRFNK